MKRDAHLVRELLVYLRGIEASKQPGDTLVLVQPHYEEVAVPGGFRIDGYNGQQIDDHLRLLINERLIVGRAEAIGIHFDHLTVAGQSFVEKS
ncbi:hypothetical protein [Paraburkholderia adhaesiva]|uniref:hypothetical protein n=1 Tax=Paraburkholderia adhaesiva TaxID=2883244 RepID=UPI001F24A18B|nr:hypothetical protein [Paraburkholderia adhaesiva]